MDDADSRGARAARSDGLTALDALNEAMPEILHHVTRAGVDADDADQVVGAFVMLLALAIRQAARQGKFSPHSWPILASRVASNVSPMLARLASEELHRQPRFMRTRGRTARRALDD